MNPPDEYLCPILMILMEDPVVGSDGRSYERSAIEEALKRDPRSPLSREPMKASSLRPNYALKSLIERYKGYTVVQVQQQRQQQQQPQQQQQQPQQQSSKSYKYPIPYLSQPLLERPVRVVQAQAPAKKYIIVLFTLVSLGSLVAVLAVLAR